jgi:pimeloyl-ACP methyl ester carboxylesterase
VSDAPAWFRSALATPYDEHTVEVRGCPIHYLRWGDASRPGLVLVHGGSAHAHWWSFIAPLLADQYHVVAPDLSGHGDSGRRESYAPEICAEEILAVAADAGIVGAPILVGHSRGGVMVICAAALYGDRLAGAIIVDSPVTRPDPEGEEARQPHSAFRRSEPKVYPDLETAMGRFRLVPPQPCENEYILDHIALHSLREVDGGWSWKFDLGIFQRAAPLVSISDYLARVRCRVALFRGELSELVTQGVADYMYEVLGRNAPVVEIPQAYHHLMLDQPLAFIAALRAILADWEHSLPRKPLTRG